MTNEVEVAEENVVEPTKSLFASRQNSDAGVQVVETTENVEEQPIHHNVEDVAVQQERLETAVEPEVENAVEVEAEVATEETVQEPVAEEAEVPSEQPEEAVEPTEEVPADEPAAVEAEAPAEVKQEEPANAKVSPKDVKELSEKIETLQSEKEVKAKAVRKEVIDQIAVIVKQYDIPIKELVVALGGIPSPRKGTKAPILFKDKDGNKWSGRGRTPNWLKDKNPEDYRIK